MTRSTLLVHAAPDVLRAMPNATIGDVKRLFNTSSLTNIALMSEADRAKILAQLEQSAA